MYQYEKPSKRRHERATSDYSCCNSLLKYRGDPAETLNLVLSEPSIRCSVEAGLKAGERKHRRKISLIVVLLK